MSAREFCLVFIGGAFVFASMLYLVLWYIGRGKDASVVKGTWYERAGKGPWL